MHHCHWADVGNIDKTTASNSSEPTFILHGMNQSDGLVQDCNDSSALAME